MLKKLKAKMHKGGGEPGVSDDTTDVGSHPTPGSSGATTPTSAGTQYAKQGSSTSTSPRGTTTPGRSPTPAGGASDTHSKPTATEKAASYVPGTIENREKEAQQTADGAGAYDQTSRAANPDSMNGKTAGSHAGTGTIGGGQNLAVGETSAYQAGPLPDLQEKRREMADVMYSTPGVPHVAHSASFRDTMTVAGDKQPWEVAMMKTEQASKEVAAANMSQQTAARSLQQAEQAEAVVRQESRAVDQLLAEAERQRAIIDKLAGLQSQLQAAQANLAARQESAARHNKQLLEAQELAAARQAELDKARAPVQSHERGIQAAAEEYDAAMSHSRGVHNDADRLKALALETDRVRTDLSDALEDLLEKLRLAEERMVQSERAFLEAQERHRGLQNDLARSRSEMDPILARLKKAEAAAYVSIEAAKGWEEKLGHLREIMDRERAELTRLQRLHDELRAALEAALAEQAHQRSQAEPLTRALDDAERQVLARREALREAEVTAKEAEARYHQLVKQADAHRVRSAEASKAAQVAAGEHASLMKEVHLHNSRHAELWAAAERAGEQGSANATAAIQKLEGKLHNFTMQSEP